MLGTGDYQFVIADRGGVQRLGAIDAVVSMTMTRVRDDTGTCNLTISSPSDACCAFLASVKTVRHELVVFRNGLRVWEGPITRLGYYRDRIELDARDVSWYLGRRVLEQGFDFTGVSVDAVDVLFDMLLFHYPADGSDQFNIGPFLTVIHSSDDARTAAKYLPYSRTVFELLDKYAEDGGIDYVVNGRRLIIHDTHCRAQILPGMTETDFDGDIGVVEYGSELRTRAVTTDGNGKYSLKVAPDEWINYYGPIDKVVTNDAEGEEGQSDTALDEALASQAQRELDSGYPAPMEIQVPANTRVDPCCLIDYEQFVPGSWLTVETTAVCRRLKQWQRIAQVQTTYDQAGEVVNLTLQQPPAKWVDPL